MFPALPTPARRQSSIKFSHPLATVTGFNSLGTKQSSSINYRSIAFFSVLTCAFFLVRIWIPRMSHYGQPQAAPPPLPPPGQAYLQPYAPPPQLQPQPGYPPKGDAPVETQSRGDGFWRGCCAGLCCCCLLDMCF
ncbi:cysteine-rich and transmembrane domain-containing protein B-like [Zingiber officinale]|uniref:cysteine-rich and transmembrane domain-containing protein B-like n=1 Tax=Zingiber officinale TaxID=94328 RepID=UPI001C4D9C19|nr:cysteine-rich and transmembrane domain-containing protein B-like [Zingiber officinale]